MTIPKPVRYNADDCSIRDVNFKLLARIGGEKFLTVPECDQVGEAFAIALNREPESPWVAVKCSECGKIESGQTTALTVADPNQLT